MVSSAQSLAAVQPVITDASKQMHSSQQNTHISALILLALTLCARLLLFVLCRRGAASCRAPKRKCLPSPASSSEWNAGVSERLAISTREATLEEMITAGGAWPVPTGFAQSGQFSCREGFNAKGCEAQFVSQMALDQRRLCVLDCGLM